MAELTPIDHTEGTSLDVGCGFTEGVQNPVYATVSLDLNMTRVMPTFLEKIKQHGSHPLAGDACNLPIRSDTVSKIYWRALLEHLPTPEQALHEGRRALKEGGEAEIVLPIITSHMRHYIITLFTQFPFSLHVILVALWRAHLYWHIPGVPHLKIIKPWQLKAYGFSTVEWIEYRYKHKWFHNPWGHITRRLFPGAIDKLRDIQGQYTVRCLK